MTTKTLAITGAAGGIGRATTLLFARAGWTVGAYDLDESALADLAAETADLPGRVLTGTLDVRDGGAFATRLGELVAETGRLDVLANNAGLLSSGRFADLDRDRLQTEIEVNVLGVMNGMHAGFPHLRDTPGSVAVNLASASAIYGQAELANYSATKFYVRGLTEALDIEWGRHDIRVVDLWPLFVQTAMVDGMKTGTTDSLGIRLTADEVARPLWDAVHPDRRARALHQVHSAVGAQARVLSLGSRFSPAWLTRRVNKSLAKH